MSKIGDTYVEFQLKLEKLEKQMKDLENKVTNEAKKIENVFSRAQLKFNDSLAKKTIKEIEQDVIKLRANLEKQIKLGVPLEKLQYLKNNLDKAENALKTFKRTSEETSTVAESGFSKMSASILKATGVIFLLKRALDFATEFKNAARDAQETQNKFDVVFESIREQANKTADSLANDFGLARSTAQKLLGDTGDIFVGFGFSESFALEQSKRVVQLSQDLASFTNFEGGAERAASALTKAVLGETESAKALGIVLRQDTKEFNDQVSELMRTKNMTLTQARAVILLDESYRQSQKAIGDFGRTINSTANQERVAEENTKKLYEAWGKLLLPIWDGAIKAGNSLLRAITPVSNAMEDAKSKAFEQRLSFEKLTIQYESLRDKTNKTKEEQNKYNSVVSELQRIYPGILGNLDLQKLKLEDVRKAFEDVRKEIEANIRAELRKAEASELIKKQEALISEREALRDLNIERQAELELIKQGKIQDTKVSQTKTGDIVLYKSDKLKQAIQNDRDNIQSLTDDISKYQQKIDKVLNGSEGTSNEGDNSEVIETWELAGKTFAQIEDHIKNLKNELSGLVPDTDLFKKKLEEINSLQGVLDKSVGKKGPKTQLDPIEQSFYMDLETNDDIFKKVEKQIDDYQEQLINKTEEANKRKASSTKDFYEEIKGLDESYITYKQNQLEKEISLLRDAGISEQQIAIYQKEELKKIQDEYDKAQREKWDENHKFFADSLEVAGNAYDNLTSNIIGSTQTMAERMKNFAFDIANGFIKMGADMLKQWVMNQIKASVISTAAQTAEVATAAATGGAIATAYAPAASMVSLATFGANAAPAIAGITTTNAAAQALATPKFATGTDGWQMVPDGHNSDTYPILLKSKEDFNVRTPSQRDADHQLLNGIINSVNRLNSNIIDMGQGGDIYVLNKITRSGLTTEVIKGQNQFGRSGVNTDDF